MSHFAPHSPHELRKFTPTRSVESLSMLNPLSHGDIIELDGPEGSNMWRLSRSSSGWYLHQPHDITARHSKIHSIDGMLDLIGAILEWSRGYSR